MFNRAQMWKWHRWLGYLIGIQVFLWIFGGLVMAWFDIEEVRSEHNIAEHAPASLPPAENLITLAHIQAEYGAVTSVELRALAGMPVYEVTQNGQNPMLLDAVTGQKLSPLPAVRAQALAIYDFSGQGAPSEAEWLEEHNGEYRGPLPVWKVAMKDEGGTNLYVSPFTGRVVARRSDVWRIFDFFWMLHIMDYKDRTDFNHPLLIGAALIAVIFTLTGGILSYYRLTGQRRRRSS